MGLKSLAYSWASFLTLQVSPIGRKRADLVSWSIITQIAFVFEAERENPITQSIKIESHF